MKIDYIKTKGFRSHKEIFETDLYDITKITGKNRSGKSNILYAIINILLGTNLSGDEKQCLINKNCDTSYGEMRFTDNTGMQHTIIRSKNRFDNKGNVLLLDGKPVTQAELTSFYKDKKLFLSIINPLYFLSKKPADQKELVDKYLSDIKPKEIFDRLSTNEQNLLLEKYYKEQDKIFNELTEEYNLKFENKATLKLSDYIAYLEKDCQYYKVVGYSERKNATINDSDVYSIDEEIQITKSMNLYAIYSTVPTEEIPDEEKWIYLVEEELFYNEEYEKAYGIKNMIYPGVHGEHIMNIDNNSGKDITIKGVSLEELNTVCVDVGCVNMGYKISTNDTLYYHDNNDYKILNKDTYIDNYKGAHNMNLEVKNKESTRISLAWKWLDNDVVDTKIGKSITDLNNEYQIVVGLKISTKDSKCSKD